MKHILVRPPPLLRDTIDPAGLFSRGTGPLVLVVSILRDSILGRCHSNYNRVPHFMNVQTQMEL